MTQRWTKLEQTVLISSQLGTHQGLFQRLKRAGVQHFLLDFGRVRAPGHQEQLLLLGALCCPLDRRSFICCDPRLATINIST